MKNVREYTITAELRILIKPSSPIAEGDEAVAAAVRHKLRMALPEAWSNGTRYNHGYLHVEVAKLGPTINEEAAE